MKKKCEYRKTYQVKGDNYLKIKGIKKTENPLTSAPEWKKILGMIQYLSRFATTI